MQRFEIEQFELHVATYEVEARNAAEAIKRLFDGNVEMRDGPEQEYIGICDEVGMAANEELAQQLCQLGIKLRDALVPSIRSVRRVDANQDSPQ